MEIMWLIGIVFGFCLLFVLFIGCSAFKFFNKDWHDKMTLYYSESSEVTPKEGQLNSKTLTEICANFLEKRNEFWSYFGQVIVAVITAMIVTILLLTKTIDPDAGLPILSAVIGFALGKNLPSTTKQKSDGTDSEKK